MVEKEVGDNIWDGTINLTGNITFSFHSLGSSFIKICLMSDGIQVVHFKNNYCFLEKKNCQRQVSIDNYLSFMFLFPPKKYTFIIY